MLHGASQTKHTLNTYYSGMGGYRWGGMGTATTTDTEYGWARCWWTSSTRRARTCSGAVSPRTSSSNKTEKNIKKVGKAIEKLFKDFPPGSAPKK